MSGSASSRGRPVTRTTSPMPMRPFWARISARMRRSIVRASGGGTSGPKKKRFTFS